MASSIQRLANNSGKAYRSIFAQFSRPFSTQDSLVEIKPGEVGMVSGIPQEQLRRKVVIFSPARTASQQGSGKVGRWKINFLSTQKWENPLMGWTSTGDPYANVGDAGLMGWTSTGDPYANVGDAGLSFDSQEAAVAFAEKHGWDYKVKKHHTPLLKVKSYCRTVSAIVYVVDAADQESNNITRRELHDLLDKPSLTGIPLLVLGNKMDKPEALCKEALTDQMDLKSITGREVCCYMVSCKNSSNIDEVINWLIKHSKLKSKA